MRSPGLGWYVVGGVLGVGAVAAAALMVWRFVAGYEPPARFLVPGSAQVELVQPGRYVIWYEHRTVFRGRAYDLPEALPNGTRFRVVTPNGEALSVESQGGMTSETGTARSVSVARFDAAMPGRHEIAVEGDFSPRVLAVAPDRVWPIVKLAASVFATLVLGLGAALAAALYGFLRYIPEPALATAGALEPERERSLRQLLAVAYGLQAVSLVVGVTLIAAVIIDYLKRREVEGTWLASHVRWQIRTFWWSVLWCVVGIASAMLLVGFLVLFGAAVWLVYRIASGWSRLNDGQPMYAK